MSRPRLQPMNTAPTTRSDLTIRPAREADLPAISEIYNYYVDHSTCTYGMVHETLAERQAWFASHDPQHPVIVAVRNHPAGEEVIGWGALNVFNKRCAYKATVENSVYLRHDLHGRGMGTRLMEELIRLAQIIGHHTIIAGISADQAPSVALHAKLGFVKVAELREVGYKFGRWLDVIYMQRML